MDTSHLSEDPCDASEDDKSIFNSAFPLYLCCALKFNSALGHCVIGAVLMLFFEQR